MVVTHNRTRNNQSYNPQVTDTNERISQSKRDQNQKQYYKDRLDALDSTAFSRVSSDGMVNDTMRKKVNYDLFNNRLNTTDFSYVCQPFGSELGELPAQMVNRDIISGKIKSILGIEAKRPFSLGIFAVNEEATTRKEQEEFNKHRDFVIAQIMQPIHEQAEMKFQQEKAGKELSPEQVQQIKDQIAQEVQAKTPDEVRSYMRREHQDPAEVLHRQLYNYIRQKERIEEKFNKGLFHGLISADDIFWVNIFKGEPSLKVVNPLFFDYARNEDNDYVEDSEWAVYEFNMGPTEVITAFPELSNDEVKQIREYFKDYNAATQVDGNNIDWSFNERQSRNKHTIKVLYGAWKGERKVGFLTYTDEDGNEQMKLVDSDYQLNGAAGDISISYDYIPETHEGYKIRLPDLPIYVNCGPVPGQHKDMDNITECKLPFFGVTFDSINSDAVSLVDRTKAYQYYYNIILYRVELLLASDKGKILLMNINALPNSAGIDMKRFQFFLESNKIAYFSANEEGKKKISNPDVNTIAKVIDMSLANDIKQYIDLAEYIERRCGESIGVPKGVEGQIAPNESVRNAQTNLSQSMNVLEPYFQLHNNVKRNVVQALLEMCKTAYGIGKPRKLSYILDDMSLHYFEVDQDLLNASTIGVFVGNTTVDNEAKQLVTQLAHAAMQAQQIELIDVAKIIRSDSMQQAEEKLEAAHDKKAEQNAQIERSKQESAERIEAQRNEMLEQQHKWKLEEIKLKGELDYKLQINKQLILSAGFNEDKDADADGVPDILEYAKFGVDAEIKRRELALEEKKTEQDYEINKEKLKIENKKASKPTSK